MKIATRAFLFLLFLCGISQAQLTTTALFGTVTDATGAVVPNAQVVATNSETNLSRSTQTNEQGEYRIDFLPLGSYRIEIGAQGFKKFVQQGIRLQINQEARIDARIELGALTDTVEVTSAPPLVTTNDASLGRTVGNREIVQLPLVNRNVYSLLTLTAGVDNTQTDTTLGFPAQRTIVNGSADNGAGSVNYYLDGGTAMTGLRNTGNVLPNPDAVQEFRVITNSFSAEYGRYAGGVVNVVTKSGTNELHGSLFEFFRNDLLNANNWNTLQRPTLRRNQFGGAAGGRVIKDKLFFFGSYSGLRQVTSQVFNNGVVPTALERAGDFSQSRNKPGDPNNGGRAFTGNKIPTSRWDPTALNILNANVPLANQPGSVYQYQVKNPFNSDEFLAKMDYALRQNQQVTLSYFETSGDKLSQTTSSSSLPWSLQQIAWRQHEANLSHTWTISPTLVNEFWVNYTRSLSSRVNSPALSLGDLGSQFRVQGVPALPQIQVSGYFTFGQSIGGPVAGTNYYSVRDTFNWTHGSHSLKFGGEVALNKDLQYTLLNNYGTFSFDGSKTKGNVATLAGNGFADFLLGLPRTMNQDAPVDAADDFWFAAGFAQDDWRISHKLTLNLGVRYDLQTTPVDPLNRLVAFVPGAKSQVSPALPTGMLLPGDPGIPRGIVPTPKLHFSPRVGFAFDPFGDGKTSIRGAGGIFWGSVSGNQWNAASNFQPFAVRQQFNTVQSLTNPYGLLPGGVSPFPFVYDRAHPQFIFPASILPISLHYKWPYTYQFNFSVERQIGKDVIVSAAYVGSLAHRLPYQQDINYPIFGPGATTSNVNNRRPIMPGILSSILSVTSNINSSYHGVQFSGEKRFGRHFGLKSYYSFSKSLSTAQTQASTDAGGAENFNNIALDRGPTDFDRRHNSVTSVIWQINYFEHVNPILRAVINDWQISGILTFRSGRPFSVTTGQDTNLDGNNNDRANVVANPILDPDRSRDAVTNAWFDTSAFVQGAPGTDGNAQRNLLYGPGTKNIDVGIFRNFKITERITLEARGELTNAFNIVTLMNPTGALNSSLFGQIRSAEDMRQTQLGLRLTF